MSNDKALIIPITDEHRKYLRRLIGISFGLAFTDEVENAMDLINEVLENGYYDSIKQSDELNKLGKLFNWKKNKDKHFL